MQTNFRLMFSQIRENNSASLDAFIHSKNSLSEDVLREIASYLFGLHCHHLVHSVLSVHSITRIILPFWEVHFYSLRC